MRRHRRQRVRWRVVLPLAALFALLWGSALLFPSIYPPRLPPAPADPHAKPLDFASPDLRRALERYAMFTLSHGLPRIDSRCHGTQETYRVVRTPGLSDDPFVAVDVEMSGTEAHVKIWRFAHAAPDGYAWQVASDRHLDAATLDAVRSATAGLLLSDAPAAIASYIVDAPEEVVEACRHERYHFWRRMGASTPADTPFYRLVGILLALSPQRTP